MVGWPTVCATQHFLFLFVVFFLWSSAVFVGKLTLSYMSTCVPCVLCFRFASSHEGRRPYEARDSRAIFGGNHQDRHLFPSRRKDDDHVRSEGPLLRSGRRRQNPEIRRGQVGEHGTALPSVQTVRERLCCPAFVSVSVASPSSFLQSHTRYWRV